MARRRTRKVAEGQQDLVKDLWTPEQKALIELGANKLKLGTKAGKLRKEMGELNEQIATAMHGLGIEEFVADGIEFKIGEKVTVKAAGSGDDETGD